MRVLTYTAAVLVLVSWCAGHSTAAERRNSKFNEMSDVALWRSYSLDDAFSELRCRGYSAKEAARVYQRRFERRQQRVESAIIVRYGPLPDEDIVGTGKKCPAYRGTIERHEEKLGELELRLGL